MKNVVKNNYTEIGLDNMCGENDNDSKNVENEPVVKNTENSGLKADEFVEMLDVAVVKNARMEVER